MYQGACSATYCTSKLHPKIHSCVLATNFLTSTTARIIQHNSLTELLLSVGCKAAVLQYCSATALHVLPCQADMCGIYFSISREGFIPPSTNLLKLLSHRGPD